jgi:hypothetical protein
MSSSAAVHSEVHGGGWHAWGLPGLFLLGFLDGAGSICGCRKYFEFGTI